ncbi:MAG: hypothetical protein GX419_13320 [Bacteroidales bacterium]|nr:hypothetical protein [Bacteroidales bacterium]
MKIGLKLFTVLCSVVFTLRVTAQAVVYPFPQGVESSKVYKVTVDNREVFVYDAPVAPIASFDMAGPVDIEVQADRDIKWVDIRPRNLVRIIFLPGHFLSRCSIPAPHQRVGHNR